MMDLQLPHLASSSTSSATSTQSAPRPGQGGGKRESAGSGKSFSSELREVHTAKESRHEVERSPVESDEHDVQMSSDESAPATAASTTSGTAKDEQTGDRVVESSRADADTTAAAPLPDVTTQSVLLALIAQPIVKAEVQALIQTSSSEQANTAVESVMPSVMEDGTSLPVTAADSSTFPHIDQKEMTDKGVDPATTLQAGTVLPPPDESTMQQSYSTAQDTTLRSSVQPTPDELRNLQQEKPAFQPAPEEQPKASSTSDGMIESIVLPDDPRAQVGESLKAVPALAAQQIQERGDNRPVATERPIAEREASEPQEDVAPRRPAVASTGWQEPARQNDERGMEWSGRDHRERHTADQAMAQSVMPEVSAPATPSHSTLMTNGMDHRAFSSAPSAKLPADPQPTAPTLPVQATDWMPGTSANQTKSMVLELSQADLGRVNIRVAVNQDTVHTHFSSERNELGQYLVNGQDRLQSALNASGLDLGRFQVDIDRQSAGRSFQEPTSQGQSHGHTPQGEGHSSGPGRDEVARDTAPRRGMLNLVA